MVIFASEEKLAAHAALTPASACVRPSSSKMWGEFAGPVLVSVCPHIPSEHARYDRHAGLSYLPSTRFGQMTMIESCAVGIIDSPPVPANSLYDLVEWLTDAHRHDEAALEWYPPLGRWPLTIGERGADEDRQAAAQLGPIFRTHYAELFALVYHYVRSRALAEEIIQDAFLAVWKRRQLWGADMDIKAYVFQTAHHRALNYLRRERVELNWQRLVTARREEWGMSQFASDAGVMADVDEMVEKMQKAVSALPKRVRRTIILRLQWHLNNAEIAEVMGIGIKAVERNITRGLKALREALGDGR
jgi:RNA polymerase sigma-70 factor (ECF subfamily)